MRLSASQLAALVDGLDWSRLHARDIAAPEAASWSLCEAADFSPLSTISAYETERGFLLAGCWKSQCVCATRSASAIFCGSGSEFWRDVGSLFSGSSCRWPGFAPRGQELGQAHDVVGGHGEDESGADLGKAAHLRLRETPTVFVQPKPSSMRLRSRWLMA
jgi:hypothetical protein